MRLSFALPGLRLLHSASRESSAEQVLLLTTRTRSARCPCCQHPSRRVHSRYLRTLADLPWGAQRLHLKVWVRRFFCPNRRCCRRMFAERLPEVTTAYARRTKRLKEAQPRIAQAVGCRPGVRLAKALQMPTSATTLLRLERTAPLPQAPTPRVLGVDDWAFRRGHRYGTILYDLENHRVRDLLAERSTESLALWLRQHPGVQIVSRDRAEAYAEGIREGAPKAQQVADRWRLVKNLGQVLERILDSKRTLLRQALASPSLEESGPQEGAQEGAAAHPSAGTENPPHLRRAQLQLEQWKACRRQFRLQRYEAVQALFEQGCKVSAIARQLGLSRKTVRALLLAPTFPERKVRAPRPCRIDPYKSYLNQRWQEGNHNAAQLFRQIREQGYRGGYTQVRDYLLSFGQHPASLPEETPQKVSVHPVVVWTLRRAAERTPQQQGILDRLSVLYEPFRTANTLAQRFLWMVRRSEGAEQPISFRQWLEETRVCPVSEMRSFAMGLEKDQAAVEAGLSLAWSNGPVEGSINRLKCLKRRGFGRANFDLLRRRVLQPG